MSDLLIRLACQLLGHKWKRRWSLTGFPNGIRDSAGYICLRCHAYEVREH